MMKWSRSRTVGCQIGAKATALLHKRRVGSEVFGTVGSKDGFSGCNESEHVLSIQSLGTSLNYCEWEVSEENIVCKLPSTNRAATGLGNHLSCTIKPNP